MHIAQSVANEKGIFRRSRISHGWWAKLVQRQQDLSLRRGDSSAHVRMDAVNKETMEHYFSLLEDTLADHNLLNSPTQIYNVDESGVPFDPNPPNIVAKKGSKKVRYQTSGKKRQVTIVGCATAGQVLPPMIIFDVKKINHAWTKDEVPGTKYGGSDKGWITTELFRMWLSDLFLETAVSARPILLLLDGHSTHYQPEVLQLAREHDVIMLCLPPHTMHETQPLDCGVFGHLKRHWSAVCHGFFQNNPGKVITKFNFNTLFSQAWLRAVTPSNIIAGVCPFNCDAINVCQSDAGPNDDEAVHTKPGGQTHDTEQFTSDQMLLFQKRVEEGYDLFTDPEYVRWLGIHHPELLPSNRNSLASPSAPKDRGDDQEISLADHFSSIDSGATLIWVDQTHDTEQFTSDQMLLFQNRVDEGYNLFTDPEYVRWLGISRNVAFRWILTGEYFRPSHPLQCKFMTGCSKHHHEQCNYSFLSRNKWCVQVLSWPTRGCAEGNQRYSCPHWECIQLCFHQQKVCNHRWSEDPVSTKIVAGIPLIVPFVVSLTDLTMKNLSQLLQHIFIQYHQLNIECTKYRMRQYCR